MCKVFVYHAHHVSVLSGVCGAWLDFSWHGLHRAASRAALVLHHRRRILASATLLVICHDDGASRARPQSPSVEQQHLGMPLEAGE